jgi:iron complex outermembrane recepter protein
VRICWILVFLGVFAHTKARADETIRHDHPHGVPEIIITADPLSDIDGHFAAPVTILDQKALRSESMRSVGEAVANQLGVTSSDFGVSVGRPVIRGLGGGRVRVLEDGIGAMDLSTISPDHGVSVEPIFAEQIEIFRGPATLLYGSGASGGLVNIENGRIPKRVPEALAVEGYGHYDTASDGWLGAFKADGALRSNLVLHLDGLKRDTDDVEIPGFAETMPDTGERAGILPNSDTDTENFSAGLSWIESSGFIGVNVSRFTNIYGVPGAHDTSVGAAVTEGGTRIDQQQTRFDFQSTRDLDVAYVSRITARWGYNDYEHDEIEASGATGSRFFNEEWEGRVELVHRPAGRWDGVVGLQVRDRDFAAVGEEAFLAPAGVASWAAFLFEKGEFGRVHIDYGVRFEAQDADSSAARSAEHRLVSVSGGGVYEYGDGYAVGFSGAHSQRAPSIEELFANGPHLASNTFEIGDAGLGEETSMNVDVFWRKSDGRLRFDFTLFYNDIEDFIFLASNDENGDGVADRVEPDFLDTGFVVNDDEGLLLVNQRQTDARFWGFEFEAELGLFEDARGLLDFRIWTDYVEAQFEDDRRVPRIPPLRYGAGLAWTRGPAYAGFSVVQVTDKDDTAPLETDTDGYTMVNLHAGFTVSFGDAGEITFFARGTNLADERARRHTSLVKDLSTLPGISGVLGIRARY